MQQPELQTDIPVYAWPSEKKQPFFEKNLLDLSTYHYQHCDHYRRFLDASCGGVPSRLSELPPMAAELFKLYRLNSIADHEVIKTMHSSGTSGQAVSQILLDRSTAQLQSRVLGKILQNLLGPERLPMLIADCPSQTARADQFAARRAGVQGLALFGRDHCYLLNDDMQLNREGLAAFAEKYRNDTVLMFGFTFISWLHVLRPLLDQNIQSPFKKLFFLHSGGWKKMQQEAVSATQFNRSAQHIFGENTAVHNFYGMVEQTGSIYLQCSQGHFHAPIFADIRIRNPRNFALSEPGETGLIETLSLLPRSYPGHALLTQDVGQWLGEDDCPCGWQGKYFQVLGRQQRAEARGCSDTYAA